MAVSSTMTSLYAAVRHVTCSSSVAEQADVCAGATGAPQSLADHLDLCMERIRKLDSAIGAQQVQLP